MIFREFFTQAVGADPYPYQARLAEAPWPEALEVPTGMGKTAAVTLAWLWKRGWGAGGRRAEPDADTPRRLVWCLPMRVLVEQTAGATGQWLERLGLTDQVAVHLLLGGEVSRDWLEAPEHDAVLIGTQDMLLSRALMRGYGLSRYRWPMEFALLHNDAFWVFDEVQLMGVGMATSAQLEAFRRAWPLARPARSLWLSATLRSDWLATVDFRPHLESLQTQTLTLSEDERSRPEVARRLQAPKALARAGFALDDDSAGGNARDYLASLAAAVQAAHRPGTTTLVVVNRVARAQGLYQLLNKAVDTPLILVHSRFRPAERRELNRRLVEEEGERIIVATQAVEAGVDLSAATLFTELAPWSSLVQRFGRCNRHGELDQAQIFWIDIDSDKQAPPYEPETLAAARDRLQGLQQAGPAHLPPVEEGADWQQVIRRGDFLDLFDTDPDLTGFDVDVSPYVRDTDDRDLLGFWRELGEDVQAEPAPAAEELCRIPLGEARKLLDRLNKANRTAWIWDHLERRWTPFRGAPRPGLVLMLPVEAGGYDPELGLFISHKKTVPAVPAPEAIPEADEDERLTTLGRAVPLPEHLCHVETHARDLGEVLAPEQVETLSTAGRWHDLGKAHPAFQHAVQAAFDDPEQARTKLWAKSPRLDGRLDYGVDGQPRRHFRHELASMLAWLAHHDGAPEADLIAYLILAHHGKLRLRLRALPGENEPSDGRLFCRGVWAGDRLPPLSACKEAVGETELQLDLMRLGLGAQGPSWTERTAALLQQYGPFRLAWLETLLRLADWRASRAEQEQFA
ncbi:MAG: CRISPR-associated endonuclease Cas3'' [Acidobacteria bacterium]|nr:MAG: CRISPR-associated endonuclease Cas3'' [Acidobacteriota bacterium]